ncbi:SDR family NAD(P)-dependent oxidoreductase [Bradyrhizobium sp.]|uniref:SDR family NAD(P)-dependent oxidoreductase n=1 Tax=Bradyrhizobium sp. TaxID=376 RepID=UPI0025C4023A|nr:SDR family NAD(P)-dependent oxidoreductase [Bradyrhizobium sp.]
MTGSGSSATTAHQRRLRSKYGAWALVTGASDGIGKAIAGQLAEAGFNLVLVARRREVLEALAADLARQHRIEARALALDLGQRTAVSTLVSATEDLDVGLLAAVAGFGTSGGFVDGLLDRELDMVDVNCRAVVELSHHFAGRFVAQRRGGLILMSSLLAFQGVPRAATYAATKAFIQTFAEGLRLELSRSGVDVVSCAPGPVRSGFEARANMRMSSAASPQVVARQTLDALGRRTTVRPGFLSKFLEASLLPLPRRARSQIMGVVMGGMTRHQNGSKEQQDGGLA